MRSNNIKFTGSHGVQLSARIDEPENQPIRATALFAHCFTCSKNLSSIGHICRTLTDHGIMVFRFDFTGLGESEGDFANTNFSSNVEDLHAAAEFMKQEWEAPKMLIGHSLGGAAVLQAEDLIDSVEAVVTIGAPSNPKHVTHLLQDKIDEIERKGVANIKLYGREFTIKKQFLDNLDEHVMSEIIKNMREALLIFHSPIDNMVGIENAARIYEVARHPKSFISLDNADHMLTHDEDAMYIGSVTAAWADRYL